jgi:hypothetical protein
MTAAIIKYLSVFGTSMLKFIFGPIIGAALGLTVFETWISTVMGMMATVLIITYAGTELRKRIFRQYFSKKRKFTPYNRRMVKIWNRYGIVGVAFLTPIILSPPVGSILAVAFGEKKKKIITAMLISACVWGLLLSLVLTFGKEQIDMLYQHFQSMI